MVEQIIFPQIKDINIVLKKYPQLKYHSTSNTWKLHGSIDIMDNEGIFYEDYDIEIVGSPSFPKRFPKLFEMSDKFPKTADWHTYTDKSCCTAVVPVEILACKNNITLLRYINEFVIPYLANQKYKQITGYYKNGEYSHNKLGELEYFQELFFSKNKDVILTSLKQALTNTAPSGNSSCYCGSNKKYKHCHTKAVKRACLLDKTYLRHIIATSYHKGIAND